MQFAKLDYGALSSTTKMKGTLQWRGRENMNVKKANWCAFICMKSWHEDSWNFFLYRECTTNGELSSHLNFIETFHSLLQRHSSPCKKEEAYKIFEWANFTRVEWDGKEMLSTRAFHSLSLSLFLPTTQTHIHLRLYCCCSTLERK